MRRAILMTGLLLAGLAWAAPPRHTVMLEGGRTLEGTLVRITPGIYLLQTGTELLELSEDEIATVDGRKGNLAAAARPESLRPWRKYEEIQADGKVVAWDSFEINNQGQTAITEVSFGIAPHEAEGALAVQYLDNFGNKLRTTLEPGRDQQPQAKRRELTIHLVVPVAPGELATLTSRRVQEGALRRVAEGLVLSFSGDFPDDRLLWRKVRLPKGAALVKAEPAPTARFKQDGCEYVMWRRYFWAGEEFPTTVVFSLP